MDPIAHLALFAKAKLVFERPDTFLSFPALSPISYSVDRLSFGTQPADPNGRKRDLSEFARIVNQAPDGPIFDMTGGPYLWDIYQEILTTAVVPQDQASPAEAAAYQAAIAFLRTTDANGIQKDSQAQTAYKQYRDAWFHAVESYKAQQITAQFETNAAAQAQWRDSDEPRLRGLVDQAMAEWTANGFKAQVEQANLSVQNFEARSPHLTWGKWRSLFNPDLDLETDTTQQSYALTGFAPANAFAEDWPTFSLGADEIKALAAQAPKELTSIFASTAGASEVQRLSFEYRSVAVTRPWFLPGVLSARFWRFPESIKPLSDGASPPGGRWLSLVTALIFVRNINLIVGGNAHAVAAPAQPMRAIPAMTRDQVLWRPSPATLTPSRPASPLPVSAVAGSPNVRMMTAKRLLGTEMPVFRSAVTPLRPDVVYRTDYARLKMAGFESVRAAAPPPPQPAPSPAPAPSNVQPDRNSISILALICKRLPKTPDPSAEFVW